MVTEETKREIFEFLKTNLTFATEYEYDGSVFLKLVLIDPVTDEKHQIGSACIEQPSYDG